MSHNPGIKNFPRPSIFVESRGMTVSVPMLVMRPSRTTTVTPDTVVPPFGSMTVTPVIASGRWVSDCAAAALTSAQRITALRMMRSPTLTPVVRLTLVQQRTISPSVQTWLVIPVAESRAAGDATRGDCEHALDPCGRSGPLACDRQPPVRRVFPASGEGFEAERPPA